MSEFQGCGLHSEAIFRVYEAGTGREDTRAFCHAQELHRLHAWAAAYAFLRPGDCAGEARRTVEIVKSLPVEVQAIVADAEVSLPSGCVAAFMRTIRAAGWPAVEYTCPGCGVEHVPPIWIADYPIRPAGTWIAHQFSSSYTCRGVFGDCSIDEGLLSIRRVKPKPKPTRPQLLKLRELERKFLTRHHCRQPPWHVAVGLSGRPNGRYQHACHVVLAHGKQTNRELRS